MLYVGMWGFIAVFAAVGVRASQQLAGLRQELAAARRLAAYRLEARLGVGGMNEVWLARHERNGRAVALKILKRMPSEVLRQRFEREGATLRALRSPHTVRVLDVGSSDDGVMFIVMEAIEGVDLECLVRQQGPLSLSRALRLARHVCASLSEAHAAGIVHRDIKPSNLMVSRHDGRDHLCVIDFGIAHVDNPDETLLTNARSVIGTPQYMAPEAFDHAPATAALDIYGLGATISFMVTGYRPFEGLMGAELVHAVRNEAPDVALLAQRSPALCDLVLRCLAKDPTQRPHSIAELDTALAALETADRTTLDDSFEHCATMREVTRAPLRDTPLATTT
jgi:serine/threonine-protein kinase